MPTYEYVCTDCETRLEVVQRMTEDPLTTCGACGGNLRRVFHPAGILFKGSGFYATDNRSKPKASTRSDSATTAATSGSDSGGGSGSDSGGASKGSKDAKGSSTPASTGAKGSS